MSKTTILLASRSETVCAFISGILKKRDDYILITAHDETELETHLERRTPDILAVENCFARSETPSYIAAIAKDTPGLRVAAFALDECPARNAAIFIARGAESFLCFRASIKEITRALNLLARGKSYLPKEVEKAVNARDMQPAGHGPLTIREREVGRLIAAGFTAPEIATQLDVSPKTIDTHRSHLYEKTNCRRRSDFVAYAIRTGLLDKEEQCSYA